MPNYSQVTSVAKGEKNPNYIKLKEINENITGWYIGAAINESRFNKSKVGTIHLLQPNGTVLGLNLTGGQTVEFLKYSGIVAPELLGKFVKIFVKEIQETDKGFPYVKLTAASVDAPKAMPEHDFDLVPFVDYTSAENRAKSREGVFADGTPVVGTPATASSTPAATEPVETAPIDNLVASKTDTKATITKGNHFDGLFE